MSSDTEIELYEEVIENPPYQLPYNRRSYSPITVARGPTETAIFHGPISIIGRTENEEFSSTGLSASVPRPTLRFELPGRTESTAVVTDRDGLTETPECPGQRATLSGQKCRPLTLVSGDIKFVRIFAGVLCRGGVKRQWGNRKRQFSWFWTLRLRHLRKWGQHYYTVLFSLLSPFQWPQNMWPWMTLTGYLALNSAFAPVWLADTARLRKIIVWRLINIDTYCQRCISSAGTLVSGDIRFVRICID